MPSWWIVQCGTRLIAEHSSSASVLEPFLRGRDIDRWYSASQDLWLLFIPWHFPLHLDPSIAGVSDTAEQLFARDFPAIYRHLLGFKQQLSARNTAETGVRYDGTRSTLGGGVLAGVREAEDDYEIQFYPCYTLDTAGMLSKQQGILHSV